jgi:hypothetical protein
MPFSRRESVAGIGAGILAQLFVIVLGLVIPFEHPTRDQVDNALFALGTIGLLLVLLLPRSGMATASGSGRVMLGVYGLFSFAAILLADFEPDGIGWVVKLGAALLLVLALSRLPRWS